MIRNSIVATKREKKDNLLKGLAKYANVSQSDWWATPTIVITLALGLASLDALVLYQVLDQAFVQSKYLGILCAAGFAIVLNLLPLVASSFYNMLNYGPNSFAKKAFILVVVTYAILFIATIAFRFAFSDLYGTTQTFAEVYDAESNMYYIEEQTEHSPTKAFATVILLAIEPLVTSLLAFAIGLASFDTYKRKYFYLRRRCTELRIMIDEDNAYLQSMPSTKDDLYKRLINFDNALYESHIMDMQHRAARLKEQYWLILKKYLGNPEKTSLIDDRTRNTVNR